MAHYVEESLVPSRSKVSGEDKQGVAYRMPVKRSNCVLDNYREPFIIRFSRLDMEDDSELTAFWALADLRPAPKTQEEAERRVAEEVEKRKASPENIFHAHLPLLRKQLSSVHDITQSVLSSLAQAGRLISDFDAMAINRRVWELGLRPQLSSVHFPPVKIVLSRERPSLDEESEWTVDQIMQDRALSCEVIILNCLMREISDNPDGYSLCSVCQRVYGKTRSDRAYCSITCSNLNKSATRAAKRISGETK